MEENTLNITVAKPPSVMYISAMLPHDLIAGLIDESKRLKADSEKIGYDKQLAGVFDHGEQLAIKPHWADIDKKYQSFLELEHLSNQMAKAYIETYGKEAKVKYPREVGIEMRDMWLNVQKEGDFNPLHNHNCRTTSGLSSFCWLSFPDQVLERKGTSKEGMTYLVWGSTTHHAEQQLTFPGGCGLMPTPGAIVMFPSWLEHIVYPFKGPGERLSIASNIDVIF